MWRQLLRSNLSQFGLVQPLSRLTRQSDQSGNQSGNQRSDGSDAIVGYVGRVGLVGKRTAPFCVHHSRDDEHEGEPRTGGRGEDRDHTHPLRDRLPHRLQRWTTRDARG